MTLTFVYRSYQGHVNHRRWISRKPFRDRGLVLKDHQ